jgi:hypothetical protein
MQSQHHDSNDRSAISSTCNDYRIKETPIARVCDLFTCTSKLKNMLYIIIKENLNVKKKKKVKTRKKKGNKRAPVRFEHPTSEENVAHIIPRDY